MSSSWFSGFWILSFPMRMIGFIPFFFFSLTTWWLPSPNGRYRVSLCQSAERQWRRRQTMEIKCSAHFNLFPLRTRFSQCLKMPRNSASRFLQSVKDPKVLKTKLDCCSLTVPKPTWLYFLSLQESIGTSALCTCCHLILNSYLWNVTWPKETSFMSVYDSGQQAS